MQQKSNKSTQLIQFLHDAKKFKCSVCGEIANPTNPDWRWNGENWEHYHGYPIGHMPAKKIKR